MGVLGVFCVEHDQVGFFVADDFFQAGQLPDFADHLSAPIAPQQQRHRIPGVRVIFDNYGSDYTLHRTPRS
jgi:hypothetical protein